MSPIEPSVSAGQYTGMLFWHTQRTSIAGSGAQRGCGVQRGTQRWRGIHFVRPVVDRALVVDLLAQAADERAGRPDLARRGLLRKHGVEDGHEPVLELAVVIVGDDEVPDAVHAALAEVRAVEVEVCEVGRAEALDEVLLDAAGGGDEAGDVFVLDEVEDNLAQAGGYEVGGVAEEDGAAGVGADARVEEFLRLVLRDGVVGEAPFALCRAYR